MTDAIDDQLLESYPDTFYGYGSYSGRYWFIGLEEGGGGSSREIATRLTTWRNRGHHELEDLFEYHDQIGVWRYFGERAKLQTTWKQLSRIALIAENHGDETDLVRYYQGMLLGRRGGDSCLLELLPLPSPSTAHCLYADLSTLPNLAQRKTYQEHYAKVRAAHLRRRMEEHAPWAVIFYGVDDWTRHWWEAIARVPFEQVDLAGLYVGTNARTVFAIAKHPATYGLGNEYFRRVGEQVRLNRRGLPG
jgi:hypothetical protein